MLSLKEIDRNRTERLRGYIIYLLYQTSPDPLELVVLTDLLDARNFPLTRRRLAKEVEHLCQMRLLRVFPMHAERELDEVGQWKLLQRYANCDSDSEMGVTTAARLTAAGTNFQEGVESYTSLQRVD